MTKSQILDFLKAPFANSCLVVYFFIIPIFGALPFYLDIIRALPIQDEAEMLKLLQTPRLWMAIAGIVMMFCLVTGCSYILAHKIANDKDSPFDIHVPTNLSFSDIGRGILYGSAWTFCCALYVVLSLGLIVALPFALIYILQVLPLILKIISWILLIPTVIALFCLMILNLYIATFRFLKTLNVTCCFHLKQNYSYLMTYKGNAGCAILLAFVLSQLVNLILQGIFSKTILFTVEHFNANATSSILLFLGAILFFVICYVYIHLLHMMILAKTTVWVSYKAPRKKR